MSVKLAEDKVTTLRVCADKLLFYVPKLSYQESVLYNTCLIEIIGVLSFNTDFLKLILKNGLKKKLILPAEWFDSKVYH